MIIGFLGKGGSGKSTLSSLCTRYLHQQGKTVLAVDADHNMDLTYNLGVTEMPKYIGQGLKDLLKHAGIEGDYRKVFGLVTLPEFRLDPIDAITSAYSVSPQERLHVMTAGPHTNRILYDQACSHSLVTPLKVYLPFLKLEEDHAVVVDEKAGVDGVGTGVTTGFDAAVVVAEPTVHGMKAAKQISEMLAFFKTPYVFALNKARTVEDEALFTAEVGRAPDFVFAQNADVARPTLVVPEAYAQEFAKLLAYVSTLDDTRIARSKEKIDRAEGYADAH
jgi:CO dehydrogenase maturation factor